MIFAEKKSGAIKDYNKWGFESQLKLPHPNLNYGWLIKVKAVRPLI